MTSPVDTTVKFMHSGMLGAPALCGQAGSLIALLDACLKDGWGLQVVSSLVVASGVATMTVPATPAALVGSVVLVAGASIANLNGEQKVTAIGANTISFATAEANSTATGAMSVKMAPLGFTKPFSGTNLAAYKPSNAQANGNYLRVDDTGTTDARAVGYETMTAISTGTGLFPTAAQISGGVYWSKSLAASSTAVPWILVGDGRMFYLLVSAVPGQGSGYDAYVTPMLCAWGDPVCLGKAPDPYSTAIFGRYSTDTNVNARQQLNGSHPYAYSARDVLATGTAVQVVCTVASDFEADTVYDKVSGRLLFSATVVKSNAKPSLRFTLPGIVCGLNRSIEAALANRAVFYIGSPEVSYIGAYCGDDNYNASGFRLIAFNITGPWR